MERARPRRGTVSANGMRFAYFELGEGPLALCLHGFPDSPYTWRHLMPALADAGYRAVAPFMRAFAPTDIPPDGTCQVGALIADAIALHEALGGDDRAVLVGHDFGALATYGAAAHAPERWRRAVGMTVPPAGAMPRGFLDYEHLKRAFYLFLIQTPMAELALSANDMAFIDSLWRDWAPDYDSAVDAARAKSCLRDPRHLRAVLSYQRSGFNAGLHRPEYAAEQRASEQRPRRPTLYLHGSENRRMALRLVLDAGRRLGEDGRMDVVEGAGHFLHLERPAEVNARIVDWLTAA